MLLLLYVFVGSCLLQVVYNLLFTAAFSKGQHITSADQEPVSIVVAVHNEINNLQSLLEGLTNQKYSQFEIVIVDDRSTDGSKEFLEEVAQDNTMMKILRVNETPEHINAKKYALTLGIKAASYDLLLLTDGDCQPQSNFWVERMAQKFSQGKEIVLGYSQYIKQPGFLNYFIRFETLLTGLQYIGLALLGRPYMGVGRNLAYRKSFFLEKKGYNGFLKVVGGDDDLFVNKHGTAQNTAISAGPMSLTLSQPKQTISEYLIQKKRHLSVGRHYKTTDKIILGLFTLSNIVCWLTLIPLALETTYPIPVVIAISAKISTMFVVYYVAAKRLGDRLNLWGIALLDIIFVFYYITTGLAALVSKKVKWS